VTTNLGLDYKAAIVGTHLINRSRENEPSTYKITFLENMLKDKPWKDGEIPTMVENLSKSKLLKKGLIGTVVSFSDMQDGISKIFYFNPKKRYLTNGPLAIRNIDLEIDQNYATKDAVVVGSFVVPEMTCQAEEAIVDFDHGLLCEEGLEAFKKEWYPTNMFKSKRVEL